MQSDPIKHVDAAVREWLPSLLTKYGLESDAHFLRSLPPLLSKESRLRALPALEEIFTHSGQMLALLDKSANLPPEEIIKSDAREKVLAYREAFDQIHWSSWAAASATKKLIYNESNPILN